MISILRAGAWRSGLSGLLLVAGCVVMAPAGDFANGGVQPMFVWGVALMSIGFIVSWTLPSISQTWFWAIALLTRLILLAMHPGDDIWRYLWEGYIQTFGFSPFHVAPNALELVPYRTEWWSLINHPDVSAIYPPLTQLGFRLLSMISPAALVFKVGFVLADIAVCGLLASRFGYGQSLLYAWNPLILYSFAGGGHYDSWFLLPLVAAWLVGDRSAQDTDQNNNYRSTTRLTSRLTRSNASMYAVNIKVCLSALLVGISIAIKWISLPLIIFLAWRSLWQSRLVQAGMIGLLGALPMVLAALQFCQSASCPLVPTGSVFVAYGRSAEFIPYWVGQIWESSRWENWLFLIPLALVGAWLLVRSRSVLQFTEWYLFAVLVLSPIVHAWYFTWLIPFAVASRNWGTRCISLSAFVYFVLPHRQAFGSSWQLYDNERLAIWLPLIVGWVGFISVVQRSNRTAMAS